MPTTTVTPDRIEKQVTLDAPRSRVWRALTDVAQFNAWFGVKLSAPFVPGAEVSGQIKQFLEQQQKEQKLQQFVEGAKSKAKIQMLV